MFESEPADASQWPEAVLSALAQLYAAAFRLPEVDIEDDTLDIPDALDVTDDERRSVFGFVQDILGLREIYWAYYDPSEPLDADVQPSLDGLADDLDGIYGDIKPGIRAWETGNDAFLEAIIFDWGSVLFHCHWGLHAVSAMRALHTLAF